MMQQDRIAIRLGGCDAARAERAARAADILAMVMVRSGYSA
jgi:hypothetical protein